MPEATRVSFEWNNQTVNLHSQWVRERCVCAACVHQESMQPNFNLSHPRVDPTSCHASTVTVDGDAVQVTFADGHVTSLPVNRVLQELACFDQTGAVQTSRCDVSLPERQLWMNASSFSLKTYNHDQLMASPQEKADLLSNLLSTGLVLVENVPQISGELIRFAESLVGYVRETSWGKSFHVRASPAGADERGAADQAYTGNAIEFHVDNPYREPCIDYQLLHCIESRGCPEAEGVNRLVDAVACAEHLREIDREAFDILCQVPVKWEVDMPHMTRTPIIQLDVDGNLVRRVFLSPKSGGYAPPIEVDRLEKFFEAKRKFYRLLEDENHVVRHQLQPGQLLIFGNSRILHARSWYNSQTVSRHLEGLYIDHDTVTSSMWRYRKQAKEAASRVEDQPSWTKLTECNEKDVSHMSQCYAEDAAKNQLDRILAIFRSQSGAHLKLGAPVDLYTHGLQTATRAHEAGESTDMIVASLLHDIGELLTPTNHGDVAAGLLAPYVEPGIAWMLAHHEIFQMYYYGAQAGLDPNRRDQFRDSPHYEMTERWCRLYDQESFDPNYKHQPIEFFLPLLREVFSRSPYWHTPTHPKCGAVVQDAK